MKTFVDLFAGLGGFHVGLSKLGLKCVFASEIDNELSDLYEKNFGIRPAGDICQIKADDIPPHDILCAGFPCQPFSNAGKKAGSKCPKSGKLIDEVVRIAKYHNPKYILLENVPQILTIQNGAFWDHITSSFSENGYSINYRIYSPDQFGIPQHRERVFVVASKSKIVDLPDIHQKKCENTGFILADVMEYKPLEADKNAILDHWQLFLSEIDKITSHTILATEFGATYPLTDLCKLSVRELQKYKGVFGKDLAKFNSRSAIMRAMPEYVKKNGKVPDWILSSAINSRKIYESHKKFLDTWKNNIEDCGNNSWQKLEWRANRLNLNLWDYIIQFRASGIRISNANVAPSLVAMTPTQIPIIGKEKRYLSVKEATKLQGLECLLCLPQNNSKAFKALGNAVNADIINYLASYLVNHR